MRRLGVASIPLPIGLAGPWDSLIVLGDEVVAARTAAADVTRTKNAKLEELVAAMTANLRYAEGVAGDDNVRLNAIRIGRLSAQGEAPILREACTN